MDKTQHRARHAVLHKSGLWTLSHHYGSIFIIIIPVSINSLTHNGYVQLKPNSLLPDKNAHFSNCKMKINTCAISPFFSKKYYLVWFLQKVLISPVLGFCCPSPVYSVNNWRVPGCIVLVSGDADRGGLSWSSQQMIQRITRSSVFVGLMNQS